MSWWSTLIPWRGGGSDEEFRSRVYRPGDERQLTSLWARAYRNYGGFVPRTVERWRWSILERPGVAEEDIRIVETRSGGVVGYGVLDRAGRVLEFAVDSTVDGRQRARIADRLAGCLEDRAEERGLDRISFTLPSDDPILQGVFRKRAYRAEEAESFQLVFVDLVTFLRQLLEHRRDEIALGSTMEFRLELTPGTYNFAPHRVLAVKPGPPPEVTLNPDRQTAQCVVSCDLPTLAEVVFGRISADASLESGAVTVEPETASEQARELLSLLSLRAPWYLPVADGR